MAIEYLGLSSINGPLIALEGVQDAFYDEIVDFVVNGKEHKMGRIVEVYKDKAIIQVFEGTENMSLNNTHTRLTGHPMEIGLSEEMLGRTFNGIGEPIDDLGPITVEEVRDVNGLPLNPVRRTDHTDPWTEAADLFRQRSSARPACRTDRKTGFSGRQHE